MKYLCCILLAMLTAACGTQTAGTAGLMAGGSPTPTRTTVCTSPKVHQFVRAMEDYALEGYFDPNPLRAIPMDELTAWRDTLDPLVPYSENEHVERALNLVLGGLDRLIKYYYLYRPIIDSAGRAITQGITSLRLRCEREGVEF